MYKLLFSIIMSLIAVNSFAMTVKNGSCGDGYIMRGVHVDNNQFLCMKTENQLFTEWDKKGNTQRKGMHACPPSYYAIDYNDKPNDMYCGIGPIVNKNREQERDCNHGKNQLKGGSSGTMCGCKSTNGEIWVVTGYHRTNNRVLCAPLKI